MMVYNRLGVEVHVADNASDADIRGLDVQEND